MLQTKTDPEILKLTQTVAGVICIWVGNANRETIHRHFSMWG